MKKLFFYEIETREVKEIPKDNIIDDLYYQKIRMLNKEEMKEIIKKEKIKISIDDYESKIKKKISKNVMKVPLYDIYSENIYIISKERVVDYVEKNSYRFPNIEFYNELKDRIKNLEEKLMKNKEIYSEDEYILRERNLRKLKLMYIFLGSFDLSTLYESYMKIYYRYASNTRNLTLCKKPSFMKHFFHLKPYYRADEVINNARNMGLIDINYQIKDDNELLKYCKEIRRNDISGKILLNHEEYIIQNNKVGLVQFYTMHGSYYMNRYLRNLEFNNYQNIFLENLIKSMYDLTINAPSFDKEYILYRFVIDDTYLKNLKVGDIFIENGFMSTTRDPFYDIDKFRFGFVLLKIKIPKDIPGIGLCIETLSQFPHEEEIILAPYSKFKLINTDKNVDYFHTNYNETRKIIKRYEFEYVGKDLLKFEMKQEFPEKIQKINFLDIKKIDSSSLDNKIIYFLNNYSNSLNQIKVNISDVELTIMLNYVNTLNAYKEYYFIKTNKLFTMTCIHNNYIIFVIEIGMFDNFPCLIINYNAEKYNSIKREEIISEEDFILFICSIAYYFNIPNVKLHAEYVTCHSGFDIDKKIKSISTFQSIKNKPIQRFIEKVNDNDEISITYDVFEYENLKKFGGYGGNYCLDIYDYVKYKKKKYFDKKILNIEIQPAFSYYELDKLADFHTTDVLKKEDFDELFQIFDKFYKINFPKNTDLKSFYIWIIENKCYLISNLVSKMKRIFKLNDNPFNTKNSFYKINPLLYLSNRSYIDKSSINNLAVFDFRNINIDRSPNDERISEIRDRY